MLMVSVRGSAVGREAFDVGVIVFERVVWRSLITNSNSERDMGVWQQV